MLTCICPACGTRCSHTTGIKSPRLSKRYTPEFRQRIVELYRSGRGFNELAREWGVSSWSIRHWVKRAERDARGGDNELTSTQREELTRLRDENRRLKDEREILAKAAAVFKEM
jgi:transposase